MRITGGTARGIQIDVPKGDALRPATDRMREAVFSRLADQVVGASFLDLFAGSGSYGLEAISRGAGAGLFVEKHPGSLRYLKRNLEKVLKSCGNAGSAFKAVSADALSFQVGEPVDLIFADPPYGIAQKILPDLLRQLQRSLKPDGQVILELPSELVLDDEGWECVRDWGKKGRGNPSVRLLVKTS